MTKGYYYVMQHNYRDNTQELLGFNLNELEKNKLFYSLGKEGNSSIGHHVSEDDYLSNSYGGHIAKFKNADQAFDELIIKPQTFNSAIELLKKSGYDVVKKNIISKNQKVVSYQMENLGAWKEK